MIRKTVIYGVFALSVLFAAGAAFAGGHARAAEGDAAAGAEKAAGCLGCHGADRFSGMSAADIEGSINRIMVGDLQHPPGLSDLTGQDVKDIAAYIASAN